MKVEIDVEQGVWMNLLMRAQQEKVSVDEVVTAWLRRATRQERTVLPTQDNHRPTVVKMR